MLDISLGLGLVIVNIFGFLGLYVPSFNSLSSFVISSGEFRTK